MSATEHWLDRLIALPTVSADSNLALIGVVEAALAALGARCTRFPDASGQKAALLARLGPDVAGGLMLSAHVDTVPVAGQDWTVPPFALTRQGGRLFGRGTTDMKGFVAAMLALAGRVDPASLRRPLWLALSYDEELGCLGVGDLLAHLVAQGTRPDLVVVGEPTSLRLGLGHKGKMAFTVQTRGTPRHSAEAPLALNALHLAVDFLNGVRALQDDLAANGARDDGYLVPHATLHVGRMSGGTVVNLVPDRAEMAMEARLLAGEDFDALAARLVALAEATAAPHRAGFPQAVVRVAETNRYPGLATDAGNPAVQAFAQCLAPDTPACHLSFGTEGGLFAAALNVPVVICGPGDMAQGHRPDEYIEAAQLAACDALLDRALARFCTSPQI